jgi:hypothetical protein
MTSGYYILNTDGGRVSTVRRSDDDPPGEAAIAVVLKKTKKGRRSPPSSWRRNRSCSSGDAGRSGRPGGQAALQPDRGDGSSRDAHGPRRGR